jgi:ribosomal protein S12 methylthiotransferase
VQKIPQISIRTAFITGFPGETERDFNELCNFVKEGWFEHVGVFEYSDNAKARSHWLRPSVPAKLASLRRRELMLVQNNIVKNRNRARIGLKFDVLIEKPIEGKIDTWQGRASFQAPEVDSTIECKCPPLRAVAGQFVKARVLSLRGLNLVGEII